jgi:hypothetical protein
VSMAGMGGISTRWDAEPASRAGSHSTPLRKGPDSANVSAVNRQTAKCITATKTPCRGAFRMRVHF